MKSLIAVVLASIAAALPAQGQGVWQAERPATTAWKATAWSEGRNRLVFTCTDAGRGSPDLTVEVVVWASSPISKSGQARLVAGSAAPLLLNSVGAEARDGNVLRWTGVGQEAFAAAKEVADAISEGAAVQVQAPGEGRREVFPGRAPNSGAAADVILRCSPSVIGVRSRVARQRDPANLITLSDDANTRCRGGSGDEAATWTACAERTEIGERLQALGWCYGRQGEAGYQMSWHRCGRNSLRATP